MDIEVVFTCPSCGCHELMIIQQVVHRTPVSLQQTENRGWTVVPRGNTQELHGSTLGYRCSRCRYPDVPNHDDFNGFYWQRPEQIAVVGAVSFPVSSCIPHEDGIICHPDGTTRRIMLRREGNKQLTITERSRILAEYDAPEGSILLAEEELRKAQSGRNNFPVV